MWNVEGWKSYLIIVLWFYKYLFDEQFLIYVQWLDVIVCVSMELWNEDMWCWVKVGFKGIVLIKKDGICLWLIYVFDVVDICLVWGVKMFYLWEMKDGYYVVVMDILVWCYGEMEKKDIGFVLMEQVKYVVEEVYWEYFFDFVYDVQDSFLEGLDDFNLEVCF